MMQGPQLMAKDIMVTKLITLAPDMDVFDAIGLLLKHKISGAPVVDEHGNFIGVFSEKDCLSIIMDAVYEQIPSAQIFGFVKTEAKTVTEETDLLSVAQEFLNNPFRRLPVLRNGKLVGQISRRDVLKAAHASVTKSEVKKGNPLLYLSSILDRDQVPIV